MHMKLKSCEIILKGLIVYVNSFINMMCKGKEFLEVRDFSYENDHSQNSYWELL